MPKLAAKNQKTKYLAHLLEAKNQSHQEVF